MNIYLKAGLIAMALCAGLIPGDIAGEESPDLPPRLANGAVIEGAVQDATPEGLAIRGNKGQSTVPWKYLSAGTRYRYERPMLAAQEAARSNALKKARAEAAKKEAAAKAAAAKAAAKAAVSNAPGTNAAGVVSNAPPAK